MSMAFHPPTYGHTEQMNSGMEQHLSVLISNQQDDWVQSPPLAEFSVNTGISKSTKCSPCFAVQGEGQ